MTKWIIFVSVFLVSIPTFAVDCGKGSYEYRGQCQVDIQPETAPVVKPSEEKPPTDKMPSYQREGVNVIDAPSTAFSDAKADEDKRDAEAQGKATAGLQ